MRLCDINETEISKGFFTISKGKSQSLTFLDRGENGLIW